LLSPARILDTQIARGRWNRGWWPGLRRLIRRPALVLAVLVPLALCACGSDDGGPESTGEQGMGADLLTPGAIATITATRAAGGTGLQGAESQLCGDLGSLTVAVMEFRALSGSSSLADLDIARSNIEMAWEDVEESIQDAGPLDASALRSAVEQFSRAADDVSNRDPIETAYATLLPAVGAIEVAVIDLTGDAGCPA
jgi:hypothetical protein